MGIFDNFKESVTNMSQGVATKAKSTTESLKLNNQIKANERTMEKLKYQIGCLYYQDYTGQELEPKYENLFAEIKRLENENRQMAEEVRRMTAEKICPQCGRANRIDVHFCVNCGAEFRETPPTPQRPNGPICPKCGTVNDEDAIFCEGCGSKLEAVPPEPEPIVQSDVPVHPDFVKETVCQNCGMVNESEAKFCVKCGSPL